MRLHPTERWSVMAGTPAEPHPLSSPSRLPFTLQESRPELPMAGGRIPEGCYRRTSSSVQVAHHTLLREHLLLSKWPRPTVRPSSQSVWGSHTQHEHQVDRSPGATNVTVCHRGAARGIFHVISGVLAPRYA